VLDWFGVSSQIVYSGIASSMASVEGVDVINISHKIERQCSFRHGGSLSQIESQVHHNMIARDKKGSSPRIAFYTGVARRAPVIVGRSGGLQASL
jgi:hypothetical protein